LKISENNKKKLIVLTGPTCSGKSSIALNLSDLIPIEIISADSMLVYKDFNIGSAKPSDQTLSSTKHHLIDIINPNEDFDAWKYMEMGREIIDVSKSKNFLVVGGTQLYIKSLIEGLTIDISQNKQIRETIYEELSSKGLEYLYLKLKNIDPDSALRISPRDKQRIIRYLEINQITGLKVSEVFNVKSSQKIRDVDYIKVGLWVDKDDLNLMISDRVDEMILKGFVNEVEELRNRYSSKLKPFRSIGYKEICDYLDSKITLEDAINLIKIRTRQFAKRQRTWLRKDSEIIWFDEPQDLIEHCIKYVAS